MKLLQYPFDSAYIIKKKKSIKKELLATSENFIVKRIAILGGVTTNIIKVMLELFLLNNGIKPVFYESEYNKYYEDAVFENDVLNEFQPDIIYICTSWRNINIFPSILNDKDEIENLSINEINKYKQLWRQLSKNFNCPIIQNNFEYPFYRVMGNKDGSDIHGSVQFIKKLNLEFDFYAQNNNDIFICDLNYISATYGLDKWHDLNSWYLYKYPCDILAIPLIAFNVTNIIKSIYGKNKKGLVLDLDNTIWGGVIGDDGIENLQLGPEGSVDQAFLEFQQYLKKYNELGVMLSVNSKNEHQNAINGLNHTYSVLKPEVFQVIKSNWNPKQENIKAIADELNILPDSLVFVDDNPAERLNVSSVFGDMSIPELKSVDTYIKLIDKNGFFEATYLSNDDINRNNMYKENIKRENIKSEFHDYNDYLKSLKMVAKITDFTSIDIPRITQLINKSNQFNLTTKRYSQSEISNIFDSSDYIALQGRLSDIFGDNGIVTVIIGKIENSVCHIKLWLMSCRVLKRNMEFAMFDRLVMLARNRGCNLIRGYYYPTSKNNMVSSFYEEMEFELLENDANGNSIWEYKITDKFEKMNNIISVEGD